MHSKYIPNVSWATKGLMAEWFLWGPEILRDRFLSKVGQITRKPNTAVQKKP